LQTFECMRNQPPKDRQMIPATAPKISTEAGLKARERILAMLSDTEMARVSSAEGPGTLEEGEEYIDLEQLEQGVKQADGANSPIGHVLPKRAVRRETWSEILTHMPKPSAAPPASTRR